MESILKSAIRSFCNGLFGMAGVVLGIMLALSLILIMVEDGEKKPEKHFTAEIAPNASGIRKAASQDSPVILKLNIRGMIGLENLDMHSFRQQLVESQEGSLAKQRVKGLILHIESPGGTVIDADGIYRAIKSYKEQYKVPVYVYIDGLCASGGMYIACAADKILSSEASLIGSIGVIAPPFMNFYQLLDALGISSVTLSAGKDKDELNPFRPWKPDEAAHMQHLIDVYYSMFVDVILANRHSLTRDKLVEDLGARVFIAKKAEELGYIDESGVNYNEALKQLVEKAGIRDDNYQVIEMSRPWYQSLFSSHWGLLKGEVTHNLNLPHELHPKFINQFLYLYRPCP